MMICIQLYFIVERDVEKDNKELEEKHDEESGSKGKWTVWVTTGKYDFKCL